jgi:6-pyruvoyltetrahydropterin/6-carboxytetrahydropterin synthase
MPGHLVSTLLTQCRAVDNRILEDRFIERKRNKVIKPITATIVLYGYRASSQAVITMSKKVAVYRKEHFNAAHRLFNPAWSNEKNDAVFGLCNNPNYHGHNYDLVVKVTGEPDPETGYVIDLKILSDLVKEEVMMRFDHKNLNLDTKEFAHLNPTAENIAIVIYELLRPRIDAKLDLQIRLYETERNFVEYPA